MKKLTLFACVAMLTSAVVFTGCKGNEQNEPKQQMPEVKTEFSISLPAQVGGNGAHRMPGTTVQEGAAGDLTKFLGMSDITLVPYATQGNIDGSSDLRLGTNITTAGTPAAPMSIAAGNAELGALSKAKVFADVSIPLSTASFLFYAKSAATGNKFDVGSLNANDLTTQASAFRFQLEQIYTDAIFSTGGNTTTGDKLLTYLNTIVAAEDGDSHHWYDTAQIANKAMKAMFATFTSMTGLSSFEVARVLTDLNMSLAPLAASNTLAANIRAAIKNGTYIDTDKYTATDSVKMVSPYNEFPQEYNIPEGSISIQWDNTNHGFKEGAWSNNMAHPDNYVYPAQLWYYVNSQIKTSNKSQKNAYDNANNWAAILGLHTDAASVNSLTRAVAIEKPVQYAVARLDLDVRVATTGNSKLEDNSDLAEGAKKDVSVNAAGFPVTGVLVGGQKQVKYDFTPDGEAAAFTVYDKNLDDADMAAVMGSSYSAVNYTLLLETAKSTDVYVAVEMKNNTGVDFYGAGNQLIPKNGKFYVIAKLQASAATDDALVSAGKNLQVFAQDFITTAHLTLPNLRKAYNTIPDLRTPQLELGFSVDLSWQNGHTYTIDFE